jgi:hypothetical protein
VQRRVMKFKFCGDLDAPDWLLLEIATLSKVGTVNFKLMVMQVMAELLGGEIDYAKLEKALSDASDIKASVAALAFILNSAARYDIENGLLTNELQQLGLQKGSPQPRPVSGSPSEPPRLVGRI